MRTKTLFLALTLVAMAAAVAAQPVTQDVDVAAFSQDAFQLTPSAPSISRPVAIDATSAFSIRLWAASQTLTVSMTGPDGTHITVGDPATSQAETAFMPIDSTPPGAAYLITVNNPGVGTWTLQVSEAATLAAPLDVVAITMLNNSRWLVLAGGGQDYPLGANIRLALVAFDGTSKVNNLTINARAFRLDDPSFAPVTLAFRDDGLDADEHAGDGIFEAFFNPGAAGTYQIQVDATASAPPAISFRRSAAATLRVVPHNAHITGFTDRGVDDNGDGLFERIGIKPTANVDEGGTYLVYVALRASNGVIVHHTVTQDLAAGASTAEVFFGAEEIKKEFGVGGPYDVVEVRFLEQSGDDFVPADIVYDLGSTTAYTIAQLQHPKLQLNGHFEAIGDDWYGDGLFDTLDVVIGVDVSEDGWYSYSAVLTDLAGHEIEFQGDVVYMRKGSYDMWWYFDGTRIGKNNINGPYRVVNVIVNGDYYGMIDYDGFTTPPFSASQFNGYVSSGPAPTVLSASAAGGTYGGSATPLSAMLKSSGNAVASKTVTFALNGNVVGNAVTDATGTATLTGVSLGSIPAGSYPAGVSATFSGDTAYAAATATAALNIDKAALLVTANDATRLYSEPNPLFTATYSGFVNEETQATGGVTGVPDLTTTATQTSSNGDYPIVASVGSLAANNYAFTFVNGTLHVVLSGIIGLDSVFAGSTKAVVDGNAHVMSNGSIEVSGAKITGNVLSSQSSVLLGPNSVVSGNVSAGTTITNQGTAGSLTPNHPLSPMVAAAVPDCSANAPDLNVSSPMTLASGTYCYHSITLGGNATLQGSGTVVINMTGVLNASSAALLNLQIASSYAGPDGVTISGNSNANVTIYAPTTNVTITGGSAVSGTLLGKTLTISGNSQVHYGF